MNEISLPMKIFGPKKEEVKQGWKETEKLHDLYYSSYITRIIILRKIK